MQKVKGKNRNIQLKHRQVKGNIGKMTLDRIKKEAAKEFPGDEALQQVHIARKILSYKAKASNKSYSNYILSLRSRA